MVVSKQGSHMANQKIVDSDAHLGIWELNAEEESQHL